MSPTSTAGQKAISIGCPGWPPIWSDAGSLCSAPLETLLRLPLATRPDLTVSSRSHARKQSQKQLHPIERVAYAPLCARVLIDELSLAI
jgi:hypothetical protein